MSTAQSHPGAGLLPVRPIRAALLAFFSALAFIEVGAGAVVGEAWKLQRNGHSLLAADRLQLDRLLERLRVMEGVVAAGATATVILWSFLAVYNASRVGRNIRRTAALAMMTWVVAPVALLASRSTDHGGHSATVSIVRLMIQAAVLYAPFRLIGKMSDGVGGPQMPFLRWYLTVAAAFAVHHVFTGSLDLGRPSPSDDLGRTAMLYLVNGVVIGVMAVMAAEATRSMQAATEERAWKTRLLHDDANLRVRNAAATVDPAAPSAPPLAAAAASNPTLPPPAPPVSVVPASMGPVAVVGVPAPAPLPPPVLEPIVQLPVAVPPVVQVPDVQQPDVQQPDESPVSGLPSLKLLMAASPVTRDS